MGRKEPEIENQALPLSQLELDGDDNDEVAVENKIHNILKPQGYGCI